MNSENEWTPDDAAFFHERAAIGEYERGMSREDSEKQARDLVDVYRRLAQSSGVCSCTRCCLRNAVKP